MKKYDLIIIGAGPAGVAAAIYAARAKLKTLILSKDIGGQVALSADIKNYPGFVKTTGKELTAKFLEHLNDYKEFIEILLGVNVQKIQKQRKGFLVSIEKKDYNTKAIIITTGKINRKLNILGETEFEGRGISYCATCDAPLFKNKTVAVIGGGNSALDYSLQLTKYAKKIYLINKNPQFKGEKFLLHEAESHPKIKIIYNAMVQKIEGRQNVESLTYFDNQKKLKKINVDGIFVAIGFDPATKFLKNLITLNEQNEIIVDKYCGTNIKGIFAAGDITNVPYKHIAIAAGQGVIAALSVQDYLRKQK